MNGPCSKGGGVVFKAYIGCLVALTKTSLENDVLWCMAQLGFDADVTGWFAASGSVTITDR